MSLISIGKTGNMPGSKKVDKALRERIKQPSGNGRGPKKSPLSWGLRINHSEAGKTGEPDAVQKRFEGTGFISNLEFQIH